MAWGHRTAAAVLIFAVTYLVIAVGRVPGLRLDRAGAALIGASLMVATNVLTLDEAWHAIDFDTIVLLLGMMIVVANLRLSGAFRVANSWVIRHARHPLTLLVAIVAVSGCLSAFLVNDAICLVLTPLVLELTQALRRRPLPYLLAIAVASNIGSTATITGNPQNIMIGSFSRIPYGSFAASLAPIAAIGLALAAALIALLFRRELGGRLAAVPETGAQTHHRALVLKSVLATLAMIAAFFLGVPPAEAAIVAGAFLLLTRHLEAEAVYREIDWALLLLFAALFIVVAGFEKAVLTPGVLAGATRLHLDAVPVLSLVAAALSNLVSNVPAVLVLKPFVAGLPDQRTAWLTLAMASTLAGNFTILGSVANLIVVECARRRRVEIGFGDYFRLGAPLTLLTIAAGVWLLS